MSKVENAKKILNELTEIIKNSTDDEIYEILGKGILNDFFIAILEPRKISEYPNIAEFFFHNKNRLSILALIRHAITNNYSFKGKKDGQEAYVSPDFRQWFKDGVMFLEGKEKFAGFIGLYKNGKVRYAVSARDCKGGENIGPDDLNFIEIKEYNKAIKEIPLEEISDLEKPLRILKEYLQKKELKEEKYQELFEKYPWIFGAQYKYIQSHLVLDDKNIPDYTGIRIKDKFRDIIEIKQPFLKIFRSDGNFSSDFNNSWNQVERYLNFTREEKDYLRRKGLNFDNPKCYLIIGYNISEDDKKLFRNKEKLNTAIEIITYNDLIIYVEETINFIKRLKKIKE